MIGRIVHYHALRRNHIPHRLAWSMSGLGWMTRSLKDWLILAMITGFCLYLMSSGANSSTHDQPVRNDEYTRALESLLADCLSDPTGRPISIGGNIYFCGITDIGEKSDQ